MSQNECLGASENAIADGYGYENRSSYICDSQFSVDISDWSQVFVILSFQLTLAIGLKLYDTVIISIFKVLHTSLFYPSLYAPLLIIKRF